jgi:CheY-like chemotaxis protein
MYCVVKNRKKLHSGEPAGAPQKRQADQPQRILVVDDEPCFRRLNIKMLVDAGYHVDSAEDGEVAWDTLQVNSYDLLITDNTMPKVTGLELIELVRDAGLPLPVIMATGASPDMEFIRNPRLVPAAMLLKPYTLAEFLGVVKRVLCPVVAIVMFMLLPVAIQAQERPGAVVISTRGACETSPDGVAFTSPERGRLLEQGAIVRTADNARADLFFRRTGTVVRLQAGTEIKLEKMTLEMKDGLPVVHTLLDLRKGRIFTVVRSAVAGTTLEIRNAAGRSVVEGSGIGRYIITADGTHVSAKDSVIPIKLIGENGITIIAAGQQFAKKDGKMIPISTGLWVENLIQLDQLQAITEEPAPKL